MIRYKIMMVLQMDAEAWPRTSTSLVLYLYCS